MAYPEGSYLIAEEGWDGQGKPGDCEYFRKGGLVRKIAGRYVPINPYWCKYKNGQGRDKQGPEDFGAFDADYRYRLANENEIHRAGVEL